MNAAPAVLHNVDARCFECTVDGHRCVAEYLPEGDTLVFTHTWVPSALRGRGIASLLVRAAAEHARREHKTIVARCSYVAEWLERHPEYSTQE